MQCVVRIARVVTRLGWLDLPSTSPPPFPQGLILVRYCHVQDLDSTLTPGLVTDEVGQRLESTRLVEARDFPLRAHDVLALDLLHEAQGLGRGRAGRRGRRRAGGGGGAGRG